MVDRQQAPTRGAWQTGARRARRFLSILIAPLLRRACGSRGWPTGAVWRASIDEAEDPGHQAHIPGDDRIAVKDPESGSDGDVRAIGQALGLPAQSSQR